VKKENIAPAITDLFVQSMIHLQVSIDQNAPEELITAARDAAADMKEAWLALYPTFFPNPIAVYSGAMRRYATTSDDHDIAAAAESLWMNSKTDIGEVGDKIPVETPGDIGLPMAMAAPTRKEGRSLSLSHRAARGAKEKAVETKEGVHEGRQSLRSKISHRIEKWAHQLDEK
jgi:hypothetical protein